MQKQVDFLEDINSKYTTEECALEQRLKQILLAEQQLEKSYATKRVTFEESQQTKQQNCKFPKCSNVAEARQRNADLIKELEISKARLRSRATYTPLEQELNKAIIGYNQQRSLAPIHPSSSSNGRKVYGPVFV